jgi:hypothetical protein
VLDIVFATVLSRSKKEKEKQITRYEGLIINIRPSNEGKKQHQHKKTTKKYTEVGTKNSSVHR